MAKIIVLDAGHGGTDPGASGYGLKEKDLTLDRVLAFERKLVTEYEDVRVILTRSGDTYPSLSERARIANNANADLFISDHKNSFNGNARGFESFVHSSAPASTRSYQSVIHGEIIAKLSSYGIPNRGQKTANFQVLRETRMPAILLEEAFIDNRADNDLMRSDAFRRDYVDGVVEGIAKCLGLRKKGRNVNMPNNSNEPSNFAKAAWEKAQQKTTANGTPIMDGTNPRDPLTREQLATILDRLNLLD